MVRINRQIERRPTTNPKDNACGQTHDEQGGQTSDRDQLPSADDSRDTGPRAQLRLHFFPKRRIGLAGAQDSEKAFVKLLLVLKDLSTLRAALQVELNLLAGLGIQLGVQIGQH